MSTIKLKTVLPQNFHGLKNSKVKMLEIFRGSGSICEKKEFVNISGHQAFIGAEGILNRLEIGGKEKEQKEAKSLGK